MKSSRAQKGSFARTDPDVILWIGALTLVAIRLVSWSGFQVPRVAHDVDDMLYLKLAQNWYWGYEYDYLAFVRRPGLPLWIAFWREMGIPFAIVQKTAYTASLSLLLLAARRLGAPSPVALAAFGLGLFHPLAIGVILRVTPDGLYTITAQCILAFIGFWLTSQTARARGIFAALTGIGIGLLVITRDEQIIAFGLLSVLAGVFLALRYFHSQRHPLVQSLVPCLATYGVIVLTVILANKRHFGVPAISEFTSSGFNSAYKAALSIPQEKKVKGVAITAHGLEQLYMHSPSWALLADSMGSGAKPWSENTADFTRDAAEVGAGAFLWLLKNSVDHAGYYSDARSANTFYRSLSEEIRAAQDAGYLGHRNLIFFQLDPDWRRWLPDFFDSLGRILAQCAYPNNIVIPYASGSGESFDRLTMLYNDSVGRTMEESEFLVDRVRLSGWAIKRNDRLLGIEIRDPSGQNLYAFSEFHERADVGQILLQFEPQLKSGIDMEIEFDSLNASDLSIVFESLDDRPGTIPLSQFLRKGSGHVSQGLKSRIEYHIDEIEIQGAGSGEYLAPTLVARRIYFAGFIATTLTSLGYTFRRRKFSSLNIPALAWAILLIAWFLGRLALNSIVDATLFQCKARDAFATLTIAPWVVVSVSTLWAERTNSSSRNEKYIQRHPS